MNVQTDDELARRLAAAYVSYIAGYRGVDYLLKRKYKPAKFWKDLAAFVSKALAGQSEIEEDLRLREAITKYIQ
ncbi:MAG TPA: hypothetical protein VGS27_17695 [Candidatus Sulfotelmatobacter sp.]|nr:hypothetical protein [Candidatus Sulfotelmatobacter sp.]